MNVDKLLKYAQTFSKKAQPSTKNVNSGWIVDTLKAANLVTDSPSSKAEMKYDPQATYIKAAQTSFDKALNNYNSSTDPAVQNKSEATAKSLSGLYRIIITVDTNKAVTVNLSNKLVNVPIFITYASQIKAYLDRALVNQEAPISPVTQMLLPELELEW